MPKVSRVLDIVFEHVASAPNGMDQGLRKAVVDLLSESPDINVDDVARRVEMIVPDLLLDHGPAEHAVRPPHEVFEQSEFGGGEFDDFARAFHLMRVIVERQVADREDR